MKKHVLFFLICAIAITAIVVLRHLFHDEKENTNPALGVTTQTTPPLLIPTAAIFRTGQTTPGTQATVTGTQKIQDERMQKLKNEFLRFQPSGVTVQVVFENKTVLAVTYFFPDGRRSSFHVTIDPVTDKILAAWDHDINERKDPKAYQITPTGMLPKID